MKLFDCITMGRFCGLHTVDECIANAELHYFRLLPPDEVEGEREELLNEFTQFNEGIISIDWEAVDKEVYRQNRELDEYLDKQFDHIKDDAFDI